MNSWNLHKFFDAVCKNCSTLCERQFSLSLRPWLPFHLPMTWNIKKMNESVLHKQFFTVEASYTPGAVCNEAMWYLSLCCVSRLQFVPVHSASCYSLYFHFKCTVASAVCVHECWESVCARGVDTDRVSPTLFKVTLTVWITELPFFLAAHTHKDTCTRHHCSHFAFRWRALLRRQVLGGPAYN